jgi:hypothetical protein
MDINDFCFQRHIYSNLVDYFFFPYNALTKQLEELRFFLFL